jgi:hypothetical protein
MAVRFDQLLKQVQEVVEAELEHCYINPFDSIAEEIDNITDRLPEDDIVSLLAERPSILRQEVFLEDGGTTPLRDIVTEAINVELQKNLDFNPLLDALGGWDIPRHLVQAYERALDLEASNTLTR